MSSPSPSLSPTLLPPPPPTTPPGPVDQNHFNGSQSSSNLYLITFLATLFLLLFVSCAIVLRSYILRRRYQRRLEEALGTGLLLAPRAQGSKRKRLGVKPKIINKWLVEGGVKWNQMTPLSAQPVFVKRKIRENPVVKQSAPNATQHSPASDSPNPTGPLASSSLNNRLSRMTNCFARFCQLSVLDIDGTEPVRTDAKGTKQDPSGSTPNYRIRVEMLQLSVLISMPSPNRSQKKNSILESADLDRDEEETDDKDLELPNMVFGVTRVNYRQPKSTPSPMIHQSDVAV